MTVAMSSPAETHFNTTAFFEVLQDFHFNGTFTYVQIFCGSGPRRKRQFSCETYIPENMYQGNCTAVNDPHFVTFDSMHNNNTKVYTKSLELSTASNFFKCARNRHRKDMIFGSLFTSKVTRLDLSGIGITYLSRRMFQHFISLKYLNLSSNHISGLDAHFSLGMAKLEELDLSLNRLTSIDWDWSYHHPSLQYVILMSNRISDIDMTMNRSWPSLHMEPSLHMAIDLTYNNLSCIRALSQNLIKQNITILLEGNSLTYDCMKSLSKRAYDNCTCDKNLQGNSKEVNEQDFFDNFPGITIIIALLFLLVVCVSLMSYIIYKHGAQGNCCRCQYQSDLIECVIKSTDEQIYENHAYIVCDDRDVKKRNEIIHQLQTKRNMKLICDENALGNQNLLSFIEKCIATSKRTLFVISSYFLDNKLCLYVLQMAASAEFYNQRCVIIILKVKPLTQDQEKLMNKLTFSKICYEYPGETENTKLFWDTLAEAINDPKLQLKVLGIKAPDHANISNITKNFTI